MSPLQRLRRLQRHDDRDGLERLLLDHPEWSDAADPALAAALAVALYRLGRPADAVALRRLVEPGRLAGDAEALADLAFATQLEGQAGEAMALLEQALRVDPGLAIVHQRLGNLCLLSGELDRAAGFLQRSLEIEPDRAEIVCNLGTLALQRGEAQRALECFERARALRPDLEPIAAQREAALLVLDRIDEVVEERRAELEAAPEVPRHHLQLGAVLLQAQRPAEALAVLEAAYDRFPQDRMCRLALVQACFAEKRYAAVGPRLKQWAEAEPEHPEWRLLLNEARIEAGLLDAAEADLAALAEAAAEEPGALCLRARLLIERARTVEARELLREALQRYPGHAGLLFLLYDCYSQLGQLAEAGALLERAGALHPSGLPRRIESQGYRASELEYQALRRLATSEGSPPQNRVGPLFILGKVEEARGDHAAAFAAVDAANRILQPTLGYDWRVHRRQVDRTIEAFSEACVARLAGQGHPAARPIFVTGMPRSGTTLTEQILCSHPQVYGAGELPWVPRLARLFPAVLQGAPYPQGMSTLRRPHLLSAAEYYLERVARQNASAPRVVDKLPHNFDYIGLIALMFPNAAIIHLDRDPRDVAVSNYQQNFAAAKGLMGFAFSLADIGHMLNDHQRIMQHWHERFPGRVFELDYQRLVRQPEPTIRALLEHCGLDWDDRVMEFHKTERPVRTASIRQVREGIYTSSAEKWRRYQAYLSPLEEVLSRGYQRLDEALQGELQLTAGITREARP